MPISSEFFAVVKPSSSILANRSRHSKIAGPTTDAALLARLVARRDQNACRTVAILASWSWRAGHGELVVASRIANGLTGPCRPSICQYDWPDGHR